MNNGDVIPHFLKSYSTERSSNGGVFDEIKLLMGEVKDVIYPDDDRSRSKKNVEYLVYAQKVSNGMRITQEYRCVISNLFGGVADQLVFTLRKDESDNGRKETVGSGSKVVFSCIDGEKFRGLILGAVRDPADERVPKKDEGHHLFWLFNGVQVDVNKDGELTVTYNGKTKIDGKIDDEVDDKAPGSMATFLKNGDIKLLTKDAKQLIHLDNVNGKVIIQRDKGLEIGDATDEMLLGKSFRDGQKQLHDKLKQYFSSAKDLAQQTGTQLNAAGAATLAPGAPIPGLTAAGALMIALSQLFNQMGQAIDGFEQTGQSKNSYLSKKNKAD